MQSYVEKIRQYAFPILLTTFAIIYFTIVVNPFLLYFLNDDFIHVPEAAENPFPNGSLVRSFSNLTLWIDYKLWGKEAWGFHITNSVVHVINSLLIYFFAREVFLFLADKKNAAKVKAFFCSLLFLLYAQHSEPIFWIIGRGASCSTLFFLISFLSFFRSNQGYIFTWISVMSFSLGLLTYESIWIFPLLITVFYFLEKERFDKRVVVVTWLVMFGYVAYYFLVHNAFLHDYAVRDLFVGRLYKIAYNLNALVARTFLPPIARSNLFLIFYLLVLTGITYYLFIQTKIRSVVLLSGLFISVLPVASLGIDTHDSESERFIYLPTLFSILIIVDFAFLFKRNLSITILVFLLVLNGYMLSMRADEYRFASMVARQSLSFISKMKADTIYIADLPTQYKGALIFRKGFEEAVRWTTHSSQSKIHIQSSKEYRKMFRQLQSNYPNCPTRNSAAYFSGKDEVKKNVELTWRSDSLIKRVL